MTDGNSASIDIHLILVKPKIPAHRISLAGKGLIDLKHINLFQIQPKPGRKLLAGELRGIPHKLRVKACHCKAFYLKLRRYPQLLCLLCRHHHHGSRAVI